MMLESAFNQQLIHTSVELGCHSCHFEIIAENLPSSSVAVDVKLPNIKVDPGASLGDAVRPLVGILGVSHDQRPVPRPETPDIGRHA